jgi:hypothetical protein
MFYIFKILSFEVHILTHDIFYFNATTYIHSILGPAIDNYKSLLKSYFIWLQKRCHVNKKTKKKKKLKGCQFDSKF